MKQATPVVKLYNIAHGNKNKLYFRHYFKVKYNIDDYQELFNIISELNKVATVKQEIHKDCEMSPIKVKKKYEKEVNNIFTKISDTNKVKKLPYLVYILSEEYGISVEYVIRSLSKRNVKKLRECVENNLI